MSTQDRDQSRREFILAGGVLALDNRLDPYYKRLHENKVRPINTNFPC